MPRDMINELAMIGEMPTPIAAGAPGFAWRDPPSLGEGDPGPTDPARLQALQLNDIAMLRWKGGAEQTALSMLRRALALAPDAFEVAGNLGLVLWRRGEFEEADKHLRRAIELAPDNHGQHGNYGVFRASLRDWDGADTALLRAAELSPGNPAPIWDRSISQLERGDWIAGLDAYESRIAHKGPPLYPKFSCPLWRGEDLTGKTIYIQGEQGIGDRIMFARYLAWVKKHWPSCRIITCMHDDLTSLLWGYRDICDLLPSGVPFPSGVDYATFLCSLPRIAGTRPGMVEPDPGFIRRRIEEHRQTTRAELPRPHLPSLRVGFVWTGNPEHVRNGERSVPLELLLPFAEDPRITCYSLQCGPGAADIATLGAADVFNPLAAHLEREGWVGTALVLLELDMLVTVDTAVAHLAGALGIPALLMLPWQAEWRWGLSGDRTPWYPSLRLIRQPAWGDWASVVAEVGATLTEMADRRFKGD